MLPNDTAMDESSWRATLHMRCRQRGGFGLNTGVQDVHNLAWKLAAVLRGAAAPSLLDTYHDERQPIGRAVTEQSLANAISMGRSAQKE
jgi:putative polyketide hydroxylase